MRDRTSSGADPSAHRPGESLEKVGGLILAQPERGYRYGLDPFLLAAFVRPRLREKVVDIGTGCGIIALLLARKWPTLKVWGLEVQRELADLAKENVARNSLRDRCTILEADARQGGDLFPEESFHRVVSNPPFRPPATGRISPEPQRALARQEISLTFANLVASASSLLGHGGVLDFIHLPERIPEIFRTLTEGGLEPKKLRLVHSYRDRAPDMALISARKGGRPGLDLMPPLVIFRSRGVYTAETSRVLGA